ncbi:MAG TPA: hypothetical protein VEB87_03130 [Nitrososphaerales archaeon]|nr:hypothetical protein [Nitrososphaerales archaeon]
MQRNRGRWRQWIETLAQKFRERGATSPDKALTARELGVHEMFQKAMKERLGQTGIFVEIGGKYYMNEQRLREFEQRWQGAGARNYGFGRARRNWFAIRMFRMILGVIILTLVLVNFFTSRSLDLWYLIVVLIVLWIGVSIVQIFYLARRTY